MAELPVLLDTSYLRRLSMTARLDLLAAYAGAVVTRRVVGEHATVTPPSQHKAFLQALRDTPLTERSWFDIVAAGRIKQDHPGLSDTDASLVAAAQKTGYTLVTADDGIYRACVAMGLSAKSFVQVLVELAEAGWFDAKSLARFIADVEAKSQYTFGKDARAVLEACRKRLASA